MWSKIKIPYYTYVICCAELIIGSSILTLSCYFKQNILLESRTVDISTDEDDETHHSLETKDNQSSSSDSSSSLEEEFSSIGG